MTLPHHHHHHHHHPVTDTAGHQASHSSNHEDFTVRVSEESDAAAAAAPASSTTNAIEPPNQPFHNRIGHREEEFPCSDGKSLLTEFDEYVTAAAAKVTSCERNGGERGGEVSTDLGFGFEVGDMVWGKVKSHPWWPGQIFNEAFASPAVRRTRREGHVLVAFFGDSSYGWFELSELIPFEPNFAEKSRQLNSKNFLKAVEEAVDEASRRGGLGVVCKCRNPRNFCATDVEGYCNVDVPDYEAGVYSSWQIRKARDGFKPSEIVAFMHELALAPQHDQGSIGFAMNKATAFTLRRMVCEQSDKTYAPHASRANALDQQPTRAPLCGPLVTAESLGGGKSATKSAKVTDNLKNDKYLFKRQDEPSNSFQLSSSEKTTDTGESYVFQKRAPAMSVAPEILEKGEDAGFIGKDGATSALNTKIAHVDQVQANGCNHALKAVTLDAKPYLHDECKESSEEICRHGFSLEMALPSIVDETSQSSHLESKTSADIKHEGNVKLSGKQEDFQQTVQGLLTMADGGKDMLPVKSSSNVVLKKVKGHKRPADDFNLEICAVGEKKTKEMKTGLNLLPTSGHLEMHSTSGKSVHLSGKLIGKPDAIGHNKKDLPAESVQVEVSASSLLPTSTTAEVDFHVPSLLYNLHALALDSFHGDERDICAVVRQFFLRSRSLVYQKSLPLSPPTENESREVGSTKSHSSTVASDSPDDHVKASSLVKPVKNNVQPDDPTKAERKRPLSDRQEENSAKRLKKIKDIKALAAEKKAASQKTIEARRGEGNESMVQAQPKIVKSDSTRKVDRAAKPFEPTILVIKFPPQTSLPSVAELKARFARFGPIDQSGLRVFWKSLSCRVVFLHKVDAKAAYKYAIANQSLFGNAGVRYFLREFGDFASVISEAAKAWEDDGLGANKTPRVNDHAVVQRQASAFQPLSQPLGPHKSIPKKYTGDELGRGTGNGGSSKEKQRVKFMLGGEESNSSTSRGEQLMVGITNNFNNASFADGGSDPSPVAMDFNSKNVQKVITRQPLLQAPPPIPATQFSKITQHNLHNSEMALRNSLKFLNSSPSSATPPTTVDISQQMISLLRRCSDVVTNLTGVLGYVPYHPL